MINSKVKIKNAKIFIFLTIISLSLFSLSNVIRQAQAESGGPPPPPVDIDFTLDSSAPNSGDDILLKLTVTPLEDMHLDIRCILPEGVEPQDTQGIILLPSDEVYLSPSDTLYSQAVGLYVGPLKSGASKEFNLLIKITDNKQHELIAIVEALAKWGIKEQRLTVGK